MDEYSKCFYCKHYINGECRKLGDMVQRSVLENVVSNYLHNTDFRMIAEENLHDYNFVSRIMSIVTSTSKISKKAAVYIEERLNELFEMYRYKLLDDFVDLSIDCVGNIACVDIDGVEVDGEFYCSYYE